LRYYTYFSGHCRPILIVVDRRRSRCGQSLFAAYKQCSLPHPNWPIVDNCLRTLIPCTTIKSLSPCSGLCRGLFSPRAYRIRTTSSNSSSSSRVASSLIIFRLRRLRTVRTLHYPAFYIFFRQNGGNMNATATNGRSRGLR
jgi:hypothetical protein